MGSELRMFNTHDHSTYRLSSGSLARLWSDILKEESNYDQTCVFVFGFFTSTPLRMVREPWTESR